MAPTPAELIAKLVSVAQIVDTVMTEHALFLNYAVNKTAAIVSFRGPSSKQHRSQYMSSATSSVEFASGQGVRQLP
eukprot:15454049-Alexandrium_andersonii.AAC.1